MDDEDTMRKKFRILVNLVTLLTAINNRGPSTLHQTFLEGFHPILDAESPGDYIMVNALAGILVCDYHVVSTAIRRKLLSAPAFYNSQANSQNTGTLLWHGPGDDLNSDEIENLLFQTKGTNGFIAISNAHSSQTPQESDYTVISSGQSYFPLISDVHWECLTISKQDSLEHHIATIEDYMKRYNSLGPDSRAQTDLFHTFTRYLIASCWMKMYRRYFQWSSWGFIFILGSLDRKRMQDIFMSCTISTTSRKDAALATMLANKTLLNYVAKEYQTPDGMGDPPTFTRLQEALVCEMGYQSFDAETWFEFHQLLVAALLGYGKTLQALAKAMNDPSVSLEKRGSLAQQFLRFSRLLWRIAYSQSLTHYLEMLEAGHFLRLPSDHETARYKSYAGFVETEGPTIPGDDDPDGESYEAENDMVHQLQLTRWTWSMHSNVNSGMAKSLRKWFRLLISHWGCLDIISSFSKSKDANLSNFNISLISVKSPLSRRSSIGDWRATIGALASSTDASGTKCQLFDANDVIQKVEAQFNSGHPDFDDCQIIKSFKAAYLKEQKELVRLQALQKSQKSKTPKQLQNPPVTVRSNATVHCEGALATIKFIGHFPHDTVLTDLVKEMDSSLIGVSKPSCPVCWDFFTHLRSHSGLLLNLHTRHPIMSCSELPPGLPLEILAKMVDSYTEILRSEIVKVNHWHDLQQGDFHGHRHTQSNSAISIASDRSGTHVKQEENWK